MSRSLNKAILIGNLGQDPEIRSTTGGNRVATFSIATSRAWSGAGGDKQEKTEWHRCVAWNSSKGTGLADVLEKYCKKGDKVYVEGRIEYRTWQDKDGQQKYTTEINVRELIMLGGGKGGGDYGGGEGGGFKKSSSRNTTSSSGPEPGPDEFEDFPGALNDEEDDLPF